jgi:hypothetical protein
MDEQHSAAGVHIGPGVQRSRAAGFAIVTIAYLSALGAALVAGAVAWALAHGVHWPSGPLRLLLRPALSAALGLAAYGVVASSAGVPEARQMLAGLQRRLPFRFGR